MTNSIFCDYFSSSSYLKCHSVNLKNDYKYKMIRGLLKVMKWHVQLQDTGLTLKIHLKWERSGCSSLVVSDTIICICSANNRFSVSVWSVLANVTRIMGFLLWRYELCHYVAPLCFCSYFFLTLYCPDFGSPNIRWAPTCCCYKFFLGTRQ